jgi:hypothetical protein
MNSKLQQQVQKYIILCARYNHLILCVYFMVKKTNYSLGQWTEREGKDNGPSEVPIFTL